MRIPGMYASWFNMLHDPAHHHIMSIANAICFCFHGPVQEMINQNPVAGYSSQQIHDSLLQFFVVDHNAHSLPTKHITGPHQDGIPHIVRDLQGFLRGFGHPVPWIWYIKFFEQIAEAAPVFGQIHALVRGADDSITICMDFLCQFEGRLTT